MPKFRQKPVVIEARQVPTYSFNGEVSGVTDYVDACVALAEWCGGRSYMMHTADKPYYPGDPGTDHILIPTLEGDHRADPGDYVIKGVKGEFSPCKLDIFKMTYEPVEEDE